ncbi:hypothetical protein DFH06DRAFT_1338548 [Mycena polygramma]|nr:hypothetical protein DFH06DRAFT_1338548 [Mycena polygramma]
MLSLAPELADLVFSFLDTEHLRVLLRVSRSFQRLALFCLLSRYGVSGVGADSGAVGLPGAACFLIPRIHHIHPIQKLTILPGSLPHRCLASVLAATPSINEVMIHSSTGELKAREVADLIAPLACSADPVVLARASEYSWTKLQVSLPRRHRKIAWIAWLPRREWTLSNGIVVLVYAYSCAIVPAVDLLILCVLNFGVCIVWLYRLLLGPSKLSVRLAQDLQLTKGGPLHIQVVSVSGGGRLTLATLGGHARTYLRIAEPKYSLSPAQRDSLLAVLDLEDELEVFSLMANYRCSPEAMRTFMNRHQSFRTITLEPGALFIPSLMPPTSGPFTDAGSAIITQVTSPAEYIPYISTALLGLKMLHLTIAADAPPDAYTGAIAAIDATAPLHTLELSFDPRFSHQALPWRADSNLAAEAHLHSVESVLLLDFAFDVTDVDCLSSWLAGFPSLAHVQISHRWVPVAGLAPSELRQSIMQAVTRARATARLGVLFSCMGFLWKLVLVTSMSFDFPPEIRCLLQFPRLPLPYFTTPRSIDSWFPFAACPTRN